MTEKKWTREEIRRFEQVKITDDLMFGTIFHNKEELQEKYGMDEQKAEEYMQKFLEKM